VRTGLVGQHIRGDSSACILGINIDARQNCSSAILHCPADGSISRLTEDVHGKNKQQNHQSKEFPLHCSPFGFQSVTLTCRALRHDSLGMSRLYPLWLLWLSAAIILLLPLVASAADKTWI